MKQINYYILEHFENSNFSILERLHINKNIDSYNYHPKTNPELYELVGKLIKERGNDANLNDIDTSEITDMSYLFYESKFNGDISQWNVSNVKNMNNMFYRSYFNGDISKWDVSNVEYMYNMFYNSPLQKNLPKWYKESKWYKEII